MRNSRRLKRESRKCENRCKIVSKTREFLREKCENNSIMCKAQQYQHLQSVAYRF